MIKSYTLLLAALLLCAMALFGFSSSHQDTLKSPMPLSRYYVSDSTPHWNWSSFKLADLGEVKIVDWSSVVQSVQTDASETGGYSLQLDQFDTLVRNNVWHFTRLGTCETWLPSMWDVNTALPGQDWDPLPNSWMLRSILLDDTQKQARAAFIARTVQLLKDPAIISLWEKQRQQMWTDWEVTTAEDVYTDYRADYQAMLSTAYEPAMRAALDALIAFMESTDYSLKVIPAYGMWETVQVVGEVFQVLTDESPFKIRSICFRMGKEATAKLISAVKEVRKQFVAK